MKKERDLEDGRVCVRACTGVWAGGLMAAHLGLGVRPEPGQDARAPQVRHPGVELVCKHDGERHALVCLVRGIAEHQTLGPGTQQPEQCPGVLSAMLST